MSSMDNSIFFMENTPAHNKECFLSKVYMNLLQTEVSVEVFTFYKRSSFYHCRNHKRDSKEGSKAWVDMQALSDLTVIYQVLF